MVSFVVEGREAERCGLGFVGDIEVSHTWSRAGGGLQTAKFGLSMPRGGFHSQLRPGARVLVRKGPISLGWGRIGDDYDPRSGEVVIDGDYRRAERFVALLGSGAPTLQMVQAIDQANLRGMGWSGHGDIPDVEAPASDTELKTIADLLNAYCAANDKVWYLDAGNVPRLTDNPTAVSHNLRPPTPAMRRIVGDYITSYSVYYVTREYALATGPGVDMTFGTSDDELAEPTSSDFATATVAIDPLPAGITVHEDFEDLRDRGLITVPDTSVYRGTAAGGYWVNTADPDEALDAAEAYCAAVLAARGPRMWFDEAVEVGDWQVATAGGQTPATWRPLHGARVRHHGVLSEGLGIPALGMTLSWIVGRCTYDPQKRTRVLEPMEISPAASLPKLIAWADSPVNPKNRKK